MVSVSNVTIVCPAATCHPSSTRTRVTRPPTSDPTLTVRASSVPEAVSAFGARRARMYSSVAAIAATITIRRATRARRLRGFATMTSNDCAARPEIDESVDVAVERIRLRCNFQDVVHEDVRLQGTHEQDGGGARIAAADHPRVHGAAEVVADDHQAPAGRAVVGM